MKETKNNNVKNIREEDDLEYLGQYFKQLRGLIKLEDRFERLYALKKLLGDSVDEELSMVYKNEIKIIKNQLNKVRELMINDYDLFDEIDEIDENLSMEKIELLRNQTSKLGLEILEIQKEPTLMDLVEEIIDSEKKMLRGGRDSYEF